MTGRIFRQVQPGRFAPIRIDYISQNRCNLECDWLLGSAARGQEVICEGGQGRVGGKRSETGGEQIDAMLCEIIFNRIFHCHELSGDGCARTECAEQIWFSEAFWLGLCLNVVLIGFNLDLTLTGHWRIRFAGRFQFSNEPNWKRLG